MYLCLDEDYYKSVKFRMEISQALIVTCELSGHKPGGNIASSLIYYVSTK